MQLTLYPGFNLVAGEFLDDRKVDDPKITSFVVFKPKEYGTLTSSKDYRVGDFVDLLKDLGFEHAPLGGSLKKFDHEMKINPFGAAARGVMCLFESEEWYIKGATATYSIAD